MDKEGFLLEIQRVAFEVERIIDKYGVKDEVLSLMVTGLVEEDEDGEKRLKAIYAYNMDTEDEMLSLLNFVEETFIPTGNSDDDDPDLEDLLGDLGISLN